MRWVEVARRNLAANGRLKAVLAMGLTAGFCVPYFLLQRAPILPVRRLPASAVDQAIPFMPDWVWVYQSVYLLLSVVPWLSPSAGDLKRYAAGFWLQACIGFAFFLLYPIEGPRHAVVPDGVMFRMLVWYDTPLNSFPSLHVGLSVYTVLFAARISRGRMPPRLRAAAIGVISIWTVAIAFAAVATRQHYAVDLPAGALLAWGCHRWAWRTSVRPRAWAVERLSVEPDRPVGRSAVL